MTNSYSLSPPFKTIIVHGLNNNLDCFMPLKAALESRGHDCVLVTLPGHGDDRLEAKDLESSYEVFEKSMKKAVSGAPFVVLGFSYGALYLQLWLDDEQNPRPLAQVLMAPALIIKNSQLIKHAFSFLPDKLRIVSRSPASLRRYISLHVWEYKILIAAIAAYGTIDEPLKIPTLLVIDPKDELVDVRKVRENLERRGKDKLVIESLSRPYLKLRRPGKYHITFHPDYFSPPDWDQLISKLDTFFKTKANAEA